MKSKIYFPVLMFFLFGIHEVQAHQGLAIRWTFFFMMSSAIVYEEYTTLYFNQLGLNASAVGLSLLIAVPFLPLVAVIGLLGDRFRARKVILVILIVLLVLLSLAPLLPLLVDFNICNGTVSSQVVANHTGASTSMKETIRSVTLNNPREGFEFSSNSSSTFPTKYPHSSFVSKPKLDASGLNKSASEQPSTAYSPVWGVLFLYLGIGKALYALVERATGMLLNVATITYLKKERASYGSYYFWAQVGAGIMLLLAGLLAAKIRYVICGHVKDGYFTAFYLTTITTTLSLLAMPWIKYEYLEERVINWSEVRNVVSKGHYIFMFFLTFYFGCCFAFQHHWEFWYIAELSGSPTIMGVGGFIRRPFVGLWFISSGTVIKRIGELQTMAVAVFIYGASMLSLSLITTPWLVLVVDVFQSAGFALSYSAATVHFSKAASKASSGAIQGLGDMAFAFGNEIGAGGIGILFTSVGSRETLAGFAIASAAILVCYLAYIFGKKDLDQYELVPESDNEVEPSK